MISPHDGLTLLSNRYGERALKVVLNAIDVMLDQFFEKIHTLVEEHDALWFHFFKDGSPSATDVIVDYPCDMRVLQRDMFAMEKRLQESWQDRSQDYFRIDKILSRASGLSATEIAEKVEKHFAHDLSHSEKFITDCIKAIGEFRMQEVAARIRSDM